MATTETIFNIPCREGSLDVIVKGDSSITDLTQDSPLLVSPPKVFIHCTCGALHSPSVDGGTDSQNGTSTYDAPTTKDPASLLKAVTAFDDYSFHPDIIPRSTSSPIKPVSTSTKKSVPERHYHEHYHYIDDDDYEGYTSDLNERVAKFDVKRNKILSKSVEVTKVIPSDNNNGVKVSFVSVMS